MADYDFDGLVRELSIRFRNCMYDSAIELYDKNRFLLSMRGFGERLDIKVANLVLESRSVDVYLKFKNRLFLTDDDIVDILTDPFQTELRAYFTDPLFLVKPDESNYVPSKPPTFTGTTRGKAMVALYRGDIKGFKHIVEPDIGVVFTRTGMIFKEGVNRIGRDHFECIKDVLKKDVILFLENWYFRYIVPSP